MAGFNARSSFTAAFLLIAATGAFAARKGTDGKLVLLAGDALAGPGTIWYPYTTDWDHWTDAGLKPAAGSLRQLAALKPDLLLPAHGDVVGKGDAAVRGPAIPSASRS